MIKKCLKKTINTKFYITIFLIFTMVSCQNQDKSSYRYNDGSKKQVEKNTKYISKQFKYKHFAIILSGPSGVGKTTIINKFLEKHKKQIEQSISATTRMRRNGEQDGKDYYFITKEQFVKLVQDGEFLEHVYNFGNYYGTPKRNYYDAINDDKDIIFALDVNGMKKAVQNKKIDFVTIFMMPPSLSELQERLQGRGTETEKQINSRFEAAENEIKQALGNYDYIIYNVNFDNTVKQLEAIYLAEQRKREYVEVNN